MTAPGTPGWAQCSGTWYADSTAAEVAALSASASRPTAAPVSAAAASLADTTRSRRGWPREVVTDVRCRNSPADSTIQASRTAPSTSCPPDARSRPGSAAGDSGERHGERDPGASDAPKLEQLRG